MGADSKIEWTDATWNPLRGCSRASEGCRNCYAEKIAARFSDRGQPYYGLAKRAPARWTGKIAFSETTLRDPLSWRRPRRVFVNSMSDLFHEKAAEEWLDRIFAIMAVCPQHTFQILTKRADRMRAYINSVHDERHDLTVKRFAAHLTWWPNGWHGFEWPLRNVWLGVSAEDQANFQERWRDLERTHAAVRFVSAEPLLGPLHLDGARPDWIIVGGESGPGARLFETSWARSIINQCRAAGVACFVKQLGSRLAGKNDRKGSDWTEWPADLRVREFPQVTQQQRENGS